MGVDAQQIENWTGELYNRYRPAQVQDNSLGGLVDGVFDLAEQQSSKIENDQLRNLAGGFLETAQENADRHLENYRGQDVNAVGNRMGKKVWNSPMGVDARKKCAPSISELLF